MRRRFVVLALLFGALLLAPACGAGTPGACEPGINDCLARCPGGGRDDVHQHPPPTTQLNQSPCENACRSQYCR